MDSERDFKLQSAQQLRLLLKCTEAFAQELVNLTWPQVVEIDEGNDIRSFLVTSSELATLLGSILSGDRNIADHIGENSITQSVILIGMCAAVASICTPNYRVAKIAPDVSFKAPLPTGHPILMTVRTVATRLSVIKLGLTGQFPESKELVFTPRIVTMVKPT